jgi:hypothetical protein
VAATPSFFLLEELSLEADEPLGSRTPCPVGH